MAAWRGSIVIVITASVSMAMERTARDTRVAKDTDKQSQISSEDVMTQD